MKEQFTLLSYDYPPNDGGISRLTASFAIELAFKGINIEVCTLDASTVKQGLNRPPLPTIELPRKKGKRELELIRYLLSRPKKNKIISTVWNPEASIAWLLGRKNIYILAHGNEVMPYPKEIKYTLKSWLRRKVLNSARCVICNSRYTEQLVLNISSKIKTIVINPGVDFERFNIALTKNQAREQLKLPVNKRIILSVSRIDDYKGHDVILKTLSSLPKEQLQNLYYVVAGKGGHLQNLKQEAFRLGLNDHIHWIGFVADDQLPILYKAADLFVLCTREDKQQRGVEGFGMVFLEAQAAGLPVIGTDAGGIPDAIQNGKGGWLIKPDDNLELAKYFEKLISTPEDIHEQGKIGRDRALNECTWQHYTDKLLTVLDKY